MRLVAIGFLIVMLIGCLFLPVVFGYTFLAGDTATARVTGCRTLNKGKLDCSGQWQDAKGHRGSGHISGVDRGDIGRSVEVRIGPLGPYAGGPARVWPLFLTVLPLLLAPPLMLVMRRRIVTPGRAVARRLLAEPPGDAMVLSISATWAEGPVGASDLDGQKRISVTEVEAPPGYQPIELPGRLPRQSPQSTFRSMAGLSHSATTFAAATDPGGAPVFMIERRGLGELEPEAWLLDTSGVPHAVVRRVTWFPARYDLLRADGSPLGTIRPAEGVRSGAFVTADPGGRRVATTAADGRRWILRVEAGAPPILRDLTLTFLFDSMHLQM